MKTPLNRRATKFNFLPRHVQAPLGREAQPLARVVWVRAHELHANDYNPNHVFGPEFDLLKLSILENGWTQPVVITPGKIIVDGFHRWTLCRTDRQVARLTAGFVPCVVLNADPATLQMATVRHNRARGQHGILKMAEIVRALKAKGVVPAEIGSRLGMELEEVHRLLDLRGSPQNAGKESFAKGWVPDPASRKPRRR